MRSRASRSRMASPTERAVVLTISRVLKGEAGDLSGCHREDWI